MAGVDPRGESPRVGVWLEGWEPDNAILPLILMGVEVSDSGEPIRDYYYTLWTQDEVEVERYRDRMYRIMGWDGSTPMDPEALRVAMNGARLLRAEYIAIWDIYFPTLRLPLYGCLWRRRLGELIRAMPVRPPFIVDKKSSTH